MHAVVLRVPHEVRVCLYGRHPVHAIEDAEGVNDDELRTSDAAELGRSGTHTLSRKTNAKNGASPAWKPWMADIAASGTGMVMAAERSWRLADEKVIMEDTNW